MIDLTNYPMLKSRTNTPFFKDLTSAGQEMNVNGSPMSLGVFNMIVSNRDLKMWCRLGMKPQRAWKVSTVKRYFGIKGSGAKLLAEFGALKAEVDEILSSRA